MAKIMQSIKYNLYHVYYVVKIIAFFVIFLYISYWNTSKQKQICLEKRLRGPLADDDLHLLEYIRSILDPPSSLPYNLSRFQYNKGYHHSMSWGFVHNILLRLFSEENKGFFIEAGALDGETLSNTLYLEQKLGWKGLLVEPNPYSYINLISKRRKAWCANICLSEDSYPSKKTFIAPLNQVKFFQNLRFLYLGHTRQTTVQELSEGSTDSELVDQFEVNCIPIRSLLLVLNVTTLDFLSLDMQGAEWNVLKTFPWNEVFVRALVVEHYTTVYNAQEPKLDAAFMAFMRDHNFALLAISDEPDYFYVNLKDPILKKFVNDSSENHASLASQAVE